MYTSKFFSTWRIKELDKASLSNLAIDIIGGRRVFEEFMDEVDILEKTKIHHVF